MTTSARPAKDELLWREINATFRRKERYEARYQGLMRALHSNTSVLWYSTDAELQREFEAGFDEGRALKRDGVSG